MQGISALVQQPRCTPAATWRLQHKAAGRSRKTAVALRKNSIVSHHRNLGQGVFDGWHGVVRYPCGFSRLYAEGENGDARRVTGDDDGQSSAQSIDLNLPRRSMLVSFTCNACGGRSERLVNPLAWEKGMVIVQCEHCKRWHKVADANNMVEEYRFDEGQDSDEV